MTPWGDFISCDKCFNRHSGSGSHWTRAIETTEAAHSIHDCSGSRAALRSRRATHYRLACAECTAKRDRTSQSRALLSSHTVDYGCPWGEWPTGTSGHLSCRRHCSGARYRHGESTRSDISGDGYGTPCPAALIVHSGLFSGYLG